MLGSKKMNATYANWGDGLVGSVQVLICGLFFESLDGSNEQRRIQ